MKKYLINGLIAFVIGGFWVGFKEYLDEWRDFYR